MTKAVWLLGGLVAAALTTAPALAAEVKLAATLDGASQTGGGDTDGSGAFTGEIDPDSGDLCYTLTVKDIAAPDMDRDRIAAARTRDDPARLGQRLGQRWRQHHLPGDVADIGCGIGGGLVHEADDLGQ